MIAVPILGSLIGGYLIGSVPFGLLLTRAAGLGDIRQIGSGNIGATNVLRTGHKGLAAATLILDAAKGALAVLLAAHLFGALPSLVAGFGALLG
ncbi:MAG TPA: glycerol-3-phosphate acyltransferase, partial [Acetobacteraceae bacterium]|nr:glycerol-3-phosphate acyltransferase [Acetobacteraceae bacterium]